MNLLTNMPQNIRLQVLGEWFHWEHKNESTDIKAETFTWPFGMSYATEAINKKGNYPND